MSLSEPLPNALKRKRLDPLNIDTASSALVPLLLHSTAPEAAFTRSVPMSNHHTWIGSIHNKPAQLHEGSVVAP